MKPELKASSIEAMSEYNTVYSRMNKLSICKLFSVLKEIEEYGIEGFTRRIIDSNGYSATFSTSKLWKDEEFKLGCQEEARDHFSLEVPKAKIEKRKIITRSSDKLDTEFLRRMDWKRINNSVIVLDFEQKNIEMSYFICPRNDPEMRDSIINNLEYFTSLIESVRQELEFITSSSEFNAKKTLTLNSKSLSVLSSQVNSFKLKEKKQVWVNGVSVDLSLREIEVLSLLKFGLNNKIISQKCNLGISRVKKIVEELKYKLCALRREDLRFLAYKVVLKEKNGVKFYEK
ncbi:MAG: hypothetical protein HRU35_05495 [Rickettsiaceae bacterium]|nr:hypothetical protein [Rickettsiaceae bacterium]